MKIKIPLFFRLFGYIKNIIDNTAYSDIIFRKLKNKDVFFIEIGANDGISQDPIFKYSKKWKGILVEPIPEIFYTLKKNYSTINTCNIFENIAISNYNGSIDFFVPKKNEQNKDFYTRLASTHKKSEFLKEIELDKIEVPCLTLNSLLIKHKITKIDILIIDTEGSEIEIITSFNFAIKPQIIFIETRFYNYNKIVPFYDRMIGLGYSIFPEKDNCLMILKTTDLELKI